MHPIRLLLPGAPPPPPPPPSSYTTSQASEQLLQDLHDRLETTKDRLDREEEEHDKTRRLLAHERMTGSGSGGGSGGGGGGGSGGGGGGSGGDAADLRTWVLEELKAIHTDAKNKEKDLRVRPSTH